MAVDLWEEEVSFTGDGRAIDAYCTGPRGGGALPGVIVVHEIWGLSEHIRDVARRVAGQGYVALAPNLYTGELAEAMSPDNIMAGMQFLRTAPPEVQRDPTRMRERLAEFDPAQRQALTTLMDVMSPSRRTAFARDLTGAVRYMAGRSDVDSAHIGSMGFCMGGGLSAYLATLSPELRACAIFYGEHPPLDRVGDIRASVLGLYGGEDPRITDGVPEFARAMADAGKAFDYHVYPGAHHAFFNDSRPATYSAEAAADAWQRLLRFFARELRGEN